MEADAAGLKYLVGPGDFVIDVGAFVGFYSALLSHLVGPSGEVWSIEPMPDTFDILSYNVRTLQLKNVSFSTAHSATRAGAQPWRSRSGGAAVRPGTVRGLSLTLLHRCRLGCSLGFLGRLLCGRRRWTPCTWARHVFPRLSNATSNIMSSVCSRRAVFDPQLETGTLSRNDLCWLRTRRASAASHGQRFRSLHV